jgi:hypothetical protein
MLTPSGVPRLFSSSATVDVCLQVISTEPSF